MNQSMNIIIDETKKDVFTVLVSSGLPIGVLAMMTKEISSEFNYQYNLQLQKERMEQSEVNEDGRD